MKKVVYSSLALCLLAISSANAWEFQKGKFADRTFSKMDKNSDGFIQKDEYLNASKVRFEKLDKNNDSKVTLDEAKSTFIGKRKPMVMEAWVKRYDKNSDNSVSSSEFQEHTSSTFSLIDTNNDSKLTKEELKSHKENKKSSFKS